MTHSILAGEVFYIFDKRYIASNSMFVLIPYSIMTNFILPYPQIDSTLCSYDAYVETIEGSIFAWDISRSVNQYPNLGYCLYIKLYREFRRGFDQVWHSGALRLCFEIH